MERNFYQEVKYRLKKPWNYAFTGYFLLIVVIFGGFGVGYSFIEVLRKPDHNWNIVAQNLATYFMATLASAVVDINISWDIENRVSFFIYSFISFIVGFLILLVTYSLNGAYAFIPPFIGCLLSWAIWVVANADNEKLSDENFYNRMRGRNNHGTDWTE